MLKFFATIFLMENTSFGRGVFSGMQALGVVILIAVLFFLRGLWLPLLIGLAIKAAIIGGLIFAAVSVYRYFA